MRYWCGRCRSSGCSTAAWNLTQTPCATRHAPRAAGHGQCASCCSADPHIARWLLHHGVMQTASPPAITHTGIARQAWPIILANASVPLLGLVDTAVIGHYGSTAGLGALALGALLFNFIY